MFLNISLLIVALTFSGHAFAQDILLKDNGPSYVLGQGYDDDTEEAVCVWSPAGDRQTKQDGPMTRDPIKPEVQDGGVNLTLRYSSTMVEEFNVTPTQRLIINPAFVNFPPDRFEYSCGIGYVRSLTNIADLILKVHVAFENANNAKAFASAFIDDRQMRPSQLIDAAATKSKTKPVSISSSGLNIHGAFSLMGPFSLTECTGDEICAKSYMKCMMNADTDSCRFAMDYTDNYAANVWPKKGFNSAGFAHGGYVPSVAHVVPYSTILK